MGKLFVVGTPIGNLEDITLRALRILREVDIVVAEDTRRVSKLLSHFRISKPILSYHEHSGRSRIEKVISEILSGKDVAYVCDSGMPGISDPGHELVAEASRRGIEIVPIPGVSALTTAMSISGFPGNKFHFEGFLPRKEGPRKERLLELSMLSIPVIIYEAPHRIKETMSDIRDIFGDCQILIARELTKAHEEVIRGNVEEVCSILEPLTPRGEYVIIIWKEKAEKEEEKGIEDALELVLERVRGGERPSEAIKEVAEERGIRKRELYRAFMDRTRSGL